MICSLSSVIVWVSVSFDHLESMRAGSQNKGE